MGEQFAFDPATYMDTVTSEVPAYQHLQDAVAQATAGAVLRVLDLGTGTGVTARRVLDRHPGAYLTGIDESGGMLEHARRALPAADLRVARLKDPLPVGPFDLVVSALAVHHLDGPGKADLFRRAAGALKPGGRLVIGDVVVPDDPADVVTPVDGEHDRPSSVADQLAWLTEAGFHAYSPWAEGDLAVLVGELPQTVLPQTVLPAPTGRQTGAEFLATAQAEGDDRFTRIACDGAALSLFALDGMELMVPGSMDGAGSARYTLEVEVDDVDAQFARLSSLGSRALKPPTTQPWGRRSTWFRDPDNNIVNFYSDLGTLA